MIAILVMFKLIKIVDIKKLSCNKIVVYAITVIT